MVKLSDLAATFADGDWIESKDQSSSGVRILQTGNIGLGKFKPNDHRARFINTNTFDRLRCTEVNAGDVLISRLPDPIGRACVVPKLSAKLVTAVDCTIVRFRDDILPEYFVRYSMTAGYLRGVLEQATGSTRQRISRKNLADMLVPLPPLDEQKRVVAKLDEAQRQIDQLTSNLDLQLAAVGYFERAAVSEQIEKGKLTGGGLRSSDLDISSTTEPAVKASQRAPLGTVARIDYGTRVTRKKDGGSKFPVYGGGGATFSLDQSNRESCFIVSRFAMSEECVRYVEGKFFLNDSGLTVSALDETLLTQSYLDHFLLARSIDIFGLGKGTAQRNLDMGAFRSIQIPLPPLDEQKRVVAILGALQQELAALRGRLDKRRSLALSFRDRALAAAFAGDL